MDNEKARLHFLAEDEAAELKASYEQIQHKIQSILDSQELRGIWTVSADFKWLVKIGD